jgi:DNA-binding XRE family transcriptional regulator
MDVTGLRPDSMIEATMVSADFRQQIQPHELRRDLDLSRERMARLVDVSSKTIERWEEQERLPQSARIRVQLAQLQQMRDLGLTVYTLDGFRRFLRTPLPLFEQRSPLQMIEQGEIDDVIAALAADYEGLGV